MHETVIAEGIINEAKKQGDVKAIYLEIGQLGHVPAHDLIECLKRLVEWEIHHEEREARVKCDCGYEGPPKILERGHDFFMIECPECKAVPNVIDGTDITLKRVELV